MKRTPTLIMTSFLTAGFITSAVLGHAATHTPLRLQSSRVTINDQQQPGVYSAVLTDFKFLYFYVPGQGLFIISNRQFGHAVQAGTFEGSRFQFDISGIKFRLVSRRTILERGTQPLWVNYNPDFRLDVTSIMFGYGDSESAPYDWPKQIGKHN